MSKREIEMKFVVRGHDSLFSAVESLRGAIEGIPSIEAISTETPLYMDRDTYFRSNGDAQFLRVRRTEGQRWATITLKKKDKGNNFNRLEHEFETEVEYPIGFFRSILGDPLGEVSKTYLVYQLHYEGFKLECAFYRVEGDQDRRLFLEVEGHDEGAVSSFVSLLRSRLDIVGEARSIFEMFIAPELDRAA